MLNFAALVSITCTASLIQRVRLNDELCYDAGRDSSRAATLLRAAAEDVIQMPFSRGTLLLSSQFEILGIVGSLSVRWVISLDAPLNNSTHPGHAPLHITVTPSELGLETDTQPIVSARVAAETLERRSVKSLKLRPHKRYVLRIGKNGKNGKNEKNGKSIAIAFRAGPSGTAGDASRGWTAHWVGGVNAIAVTVKFR